MPDQICYRQCKYFAILKLSQFRAKIIIYHEYHKNKLVIKEVYKRFSEGFSPIKVGNGNGVATDSKVEDPVQEIKSARRI